VHGARAAVGALGGLAALRRRRLKGRVETRRYGARAAETLEIIEPARGSGPPRTPVVFIHGGGWILGRKELYSTDLGFLTERGHRVYNVDYPLAPEHPFPRPLASLVDALAWIRSRSEDAERVHLMGDSAGGNLALMLGLALADRRLLTAHVPALASSPLPEVERVVSLYGVLDRRSWLENGFPGARLMLHCYGGPAALEPRVGPELALCPLDLEIEHAPPTFLAAGTRDPLAESSRLAHAFLARAGCPVELREYPGERHGFFNQGWRANAARLRADVGAFLEPPPTTP
jgi:acetyl esterase